MYSKIQDKLQNVSKELREKILSNKPHLALVYNKQKVEKAPITKFKGSGKRRRPRGSAISDVYMSKGEARVASFLKREKIFYLREKEFSDLINPVTKRKLRFDFYLPDLNTCIEYDGVQHVKSVKVMGGEVAFAYRKLRDKIKDDYCERKKIRLIRIPYDKLFDLDNILDPLIFLVKTTLNNKQAHWVKRH